MIGGSILCLLTMLLLGYTRPVASIFTRLGTTTVCRTLIKVTNQTLNLLWITQNDVLTIWLAVLSIYFIDFSINVGQYSCHAHLYNTAHLTKTYLLTVMAVDRALMVDTLPSFEQPSGTAWAARMLAIGSVAGFYVYVSSIAIFPQKLADTHPILLFSLEGT